MCGTLIVMYWAFKRH